jgi:ABC-type branched-subunit amino acid transport system permease subunit
MFQNRAYVIGAVIGGLAGFLYWKYVGCPTGTCAISSKPLNSTLYFALMGAVLFGSFRKSSSEKTSAADE